MLYGHEMLVGQVVWNPTTERIGQIRAVLLNKDKVELLVTWADGTIQQVRADRVRFGTPPKKEEQ